MGIIDDYDKQYGDNEKPVIDPNAFPDNANIIDSYDNQHGQNFLQVSADQGLKKQPALSQRILKMQAETGLPVDLIERNIDDLEQKSKIAQFDPDKYMKESPTVGKWLAEHPNNFSSAQKDLEKLNYLERQFRFISQQYETGAQTVELSQIGQSAFFGEATKEQRKRQAELEAAMHSKNDYGIEGFWERLPGDLANQAPIMGSMLGGQAKYATIGAGYGAGAALLAGQAGPQVATPEEVVTVPALATAGAVLGWRYGAGIEAGMMEGGLAYLDFEKIKDDEGNLLNQTTARGAALIVGGINGSLEGISFGVLQKTIPGLRNLSRNGVKQLLKSPTSRAAFLRAARTVGEASATEGTTEFMQELVKIAGQELLQMKQDKTLGSASAGDVLNRVFSPENLAAMKESAAVGAKVGGGISTVGATVDAVSDAKEIREAKARGVAYGNIGNIVANTEMAAALPDQTREVLQRMAEEGNTDTAFVPVESWNSYWESQGVDPQKMAFEILGEENVELYTEAVDTGGNIAMPMSNYATLLAPTEHNVFFQREIKPAPDKMNAREAEEQEQQLDELDKQAQEQEAKTDIEFQEIDPTLSKEEIAEQIPSREFASGYNKHLSERRDALQEEIKALEINDLDVPNVLREELQLVKDAKQNLTDAIDEGILSQSLERRDPKFQIKTIADIFEQQLLSAGRPKGEAKQSALIAATGIVTKARQAGLDPIQYLSDKGLQVMTADIAPEGALRQDGKPAEKQPVVDRLGFFSAVRHAVDNMKFKAMPAKQLLGSLKNVGGLKQDEFDYLGLEEYLAAKGNEKVSKEEVMEFIDSNGLQLEQVVQGEDFQTTTTATTREREGGVRREDVEWTEEYDSAEEVDPHGQYRSDDAYDRAREDYDAAVERESWAESLTERLEIIEKGVREQGPNLSEAEIEDNARDKFIEELSDENYERETEAIESGESIFSRLTYTIDGVSSSDAYITFRPEVGEDAILYINGQEVEQGDVPSMQAEAVRRLEENGILDTSPVGTMRVQDVNWGDNNATNPDDGDHFYDLDFEFQNDWHEGRAELEGKDGGEFKISFFDAAEQLADDYVLEATTVEAAKQEAIDYMAEEGLLEAPFQEPQQQEEMPEELVVEKSVDEPTKKSQWANITLGGGSNYREFLIKMPRREGETEFTSGHFERNTLVHLRTTDRKTKDGKKVLYIEEVQSDWHQSGREEGYERKLSPEEKAKADSLREDVKKLEESLETEREAALKKALDSEQNKKAFDKKNEGVEKKAEEADRLAEKFQKDEKKNLEELEKLKPIDEQISLEDDQADDKLREERSNYRDASPLPQDADSYDVRRDIRDALDHVAEEETTLSKTKLVDSAIKYLINDRIENAESYRDIIAGIVSNKNYIDALKKLRKAISVKARTSEAWVNIRDKANRFREEYRRAKKNYELQRQFAKRQRRLVEVGEYEQFVKSSNLIDKTKEKSLEDKISDLEKEINKLYPPSPVPDAPFKASAQWMGLALKRMLAAAQQGNYDMVGWSIGKVHVDRYNQARYLSRMIYKKEGDNYLISGTALDGSDLGIQGPFTAEELPSKVQKQVAEKIINDEGNAETVEGIEGEVKVLEQDDLMIGDTGHIALYDTILKNTANTVLKKLDKEGKPKVALKDAEEVFGEKFEEKGHPYRNRKDDLSYDKFWAIDLTDKIKEKIQKGQTLFQNKGKPKGAIDPITNIIYLFKRADASTFMHEMGHFYLNMMEELSTLENANQQIVEDYQTIRNWLGLSAGEAITTKHHEQWARGWERYLREGKAPSAKLRSAFAAFKRWLTNIYKSASELDVQMSPEIRKVMDRILATEEDIEAAQVEINQAPLSEDMAAMGFNDKEAVDYATAVNDAKTAAEEEMIQRHMDELKREEQKWWKEEREVVRKEIADEINNENVYIALSNMQRGKMPDGSELPEGMNKIKLNRDALVKAYGKEFLKRLPKPFVYSAKGGLHQDQAAVYFGFSSGDEMIQAMIQAIPIKDVIEQRTDAIMFERHGDLLLDRETARDIAAEIVHNEKSAQLMVKELKHLASNNFAKFKGLAKKINRPIPTIKEIRAKAERIIANKMVRDIRPIEYQRAEAKAAREAQDLFLKGDFQGAFDAKHRQLMNHELYRAAKNGKVRVDKILNLMAKFNRPTVRQSIGLAGGTYLEQIDAILERFSFKKGVSLKALDKQQSLLDWVRDQEREGLAVDVPESLLNEANRQHYKNTRLAELEQIEETVKSIEHFAKLKNKLLANEAARSVQEVEDEIVGSITAHHKLSEEPPNVAPTLKDRVASRGKSFIAAHTKMEFLFEWLDGVKAGGAVWRHLFMPFVKAENTRNEMMAEVVKNLQDIFGVYTRKERASWMLNPKYYPHINMSLNKNNLMVIALNWGNEYNRTSLMEGYGWNEQQVKVLLAELTEKDWQTVQKVWDYINTFWPAIEKMEKQLNGVAPAKVEASEVETEFGTFEGGYYPIIFDAKLSFRQGAIEEVNNVTEIFGGNWARAMTKKGHTKERTNSGGKPIKLQMTGVIEHINAVVHDLTHREAVIDINKLTSRPRIREAIARTAGREMLSQINPWLMGIANDRQREPSGALAGFFAHARKTATIVNMGFKLTTSLVQFMGYSVSTKELGLKYATKGLKVFANPIAIRKAYKDMAERSPLMRDRLENYDRDVRDQVLKKSFTGDPRITDAFFASIGYMDMAVSMATWYGAYEKALDGKVENIEAGNEKQAVEFADRTVRVTQGAGASKDLSQIQRGDEYHRMFTMFYSAFNVIFNQFQAATGEVILTKNVPKFVGSMFLLWFFPAVAEDLMLGRGPDEDADEDEWLEWFIHKEVTYPAATVVGVRDMVAMSNGFGYSPSAAFDAIEQPGRTIKTGLQFATGDREDIERKDIKSVFMTAGYLVGLPSRQVWLSSEYFYDWSTGEEEPESVQEGLWRGLVTGKPKE